MAKAKPTPFGTNEPKPIDSAPLPPQVDGNFEVSASGIITGTGRVTFEKLFGTYPTNEILREQGWPPRTIREFRWPTRMRSTTSSRPGCLPR
jgi:hypothetical protein